jgi:hypothetical protein
METSVVPPGERRRTRRRRMLGEHPPSTVRIRPGHQAFLVDVSAGGMLLEGEGRLLPGTSIVVLLETRDRRVSVRGQVLRSTVAGVLPSAVSYRSAIAFDRQLSSWADDDTGYPILAAEARASRWFRADATPAAPQHRSDHVG